VTKRSLDEARQFGRPRWTFSLCPTTLSPSHFVS